MKQCKKCGAIQSDDRMLCVDCGEVLGAPVDQKTEERLKKETSSKVDSLDREGDFLSLKPIDAACGIAMVTCGLASGVIFLFKRFCGEARALFGLVFVIGLVLGVFALTPKFCWLVEKLRLSFRVDNTDDLVPSAFYLISRKVFIYAGMALVTVMFCFGLYAAVRLRLI